MPPATEPIPVLVLSALAAALAVPDGGSNYYHAVKYAGIGKDITAESPVDYPAIFIGEPSEAGVYGEVPEDAAVLWHGCWNWDVPIFGVIRDIGGGDNAYKSLLRLVADIYRALGVDYTLGNLVQSVQVKGWTMLGPQEITDGRPWVGVIARIKFRTRDNEMVTNPA